MYIMDENIPLVVAITPVSVEGWLNLNKVAREHLGLKEAVSRNAR
jgi:hypothetical protein